MQEIDVAAAHRDDQHAERERDEIEGGEARILAQDGRARDEAGGERDGEAGDEAAKAHRRAATGRRPGSRSRRRAGWRALMASPIRLMRRSTRNTPIGGALIDSARHADQRAAHEAELDEGLDEAVDHAGRAPCSLVVPLADLGMLIPGLDRVARLGEVLGRQHLRVSPQATELARDQQRLAGNARFTCSRSCRAAITVRPSSCQRSMRRMRSAMVLASTARNGSSSRMSAAVLHHQPREQHALELSAGERADRPVGEIGEADRCDRIGDLALGACASRPRQSADLAPQAEGDQSNTRDREAAVDVDHLRQIGDVAVGRCRSRSIAPSSG